MTLLTSQDEELLQTIHFIGNFPNREARFLKTLETIYQSGAVTKETALAYGYYQFLSIFRMVRGSDLNEINIGPILEAYQRALECNPDYWPAKMCKALLYLKLPSQKWIETEFEKVIREMTELQKKCPEMEAYFIIPYLMYSDFWFTLGNHQRAFEALDWGKRSVALTPMTFRFFNEFFCLLFKDYFNRLTFSREVELTAALGELGRIFFPDEKVFRISSICSG